MPGRLNALAWRRRPILRWATERWRAATVGILTGLFAGFNVGRGGLSGNLNAGNGEVNVDGAGSSIVITSNANSAAKAENGLIQIGRTATVVVNVTDGGRISNVATGAIRGWGLSSVPGRKCEVGPSCAWSHTSGRANF